MTHATTPELDRLVTDYLLAVAVAGADLPPGRLDELLDDLSEHIVVARTQHAPTEAGVRTILDRLGPPAAIAEAARVAERAGTAPPPVREPDTAWDEKLIGVWQRSPGAVVAVLVVLLMGLVVLAGIAVVAMR